jgi:hypothetical protein
MENMDGLIYFSERAVATVLRNDPHPTMLRRV